MDATTTGAVVSLVLLAATLTFAVVRPRRLPEVVGALPAAALVVGLGLVGWHAAVDEVRTLGPTLAFLAAILVLAELSREAGVFAWAGAVVARWSHGSAHRLLLAVFVVASLTTAVLSLDATVVLLTPVVLVTARRIGARPAPSLYASTHLANTASTLLPVSNLTNLLAFGASGLSFAGFAGLMALPWVATIAVELGVFWWFFRRDLAASEAPGAAGAAGTAGAAGAAGAAGTTAAGTTAAEPEPAAPRTALAVLAATLAGFVVVEPFGVAPAWVAAAGALVLAVPRVVHRPRREARVLLRAASVPFLVFVASLGVVVLAVRTGPVGDAVARLVPQHATLPALLALAAVAAVLANVLNNLPATLVLVPLAAHDPGLVLAILLGVNIGPNLTYVGSLATLLWRQVLHRHDHTPSAGRFLRLGLATVPACLVVGVLALWVGLRLSGR